MTTPFHLIMTAALQRRLRAWPIPLSAVLLGSVAPDVALILLMSLGTLWYSVQMSWSLAEAHRYAMEVAYYTNPVWIVGYNLLHAPLILIALLLVTWRCRWSVGDWRRQIFWFASAASLHTIIDIGTHHADGPLLLFPLNWTLRFQSPISYWDPQHYGRWMLGAEVILTTVLLIYLRHTRQRRPTTERERL